MAANSGKETWYIKENGGSGELVGIASTNSNWFIAENVLRDNAEMICRLWNEQAADTKEQNFNNHQQTQAEIACLCNYIHDARADMDEDRLILDEVFRQLSAMLERCVKNQKGAILWWVKK